MMSTEIGSMKISMNPTIKLKVICASANINSNSAPNTASKLKSIATVVAGVNFKAIICPN